MGRPHAPKVDHPYVFSVSQLETFDLCNRKWAFEKIDKIEGKQNAAAELGQRVHDVLERYLKKGIAIDRNTKEGKIAFPGLKHLPLPRTPGMKVEEWFVVKFGIAAYRGLKDVEIIVASKEPIIIDHKSTRNFRWKKTKQQLLTNLQAGIYAADAMAKTGWKTVILKWVYYKTEGKPLAEPVPVRINQKQVEEIISNADDIAHQMVEVLLTKKRALDVYPNFNSCEAFGGCSYKEHCKRTPSSVLKSIMAQKRIENDVSGTTANKFLEDLKNRNALKKNKEEAKAKPSVKLEDVETVKVNPPEREQAEQPRPPSAKQIGGKWITPEWDEAEWKWFFPGEAEAEKASKVAAASKKVADGKAGKPATTTTKTKSKEDVEDIDDDFEEDPQSAAEATKPVVTSKPATTSTKPATTSTKPTTTASKPAAASGKPSTSATKTEEPKPEAFLEGLTYDEKVEFVNSFKRVTQLLEKHLDATIPF